MNIFWKTIAEYNQNTWYLQIVICAVGALLLGLVYARPQRRYYAAMRLYMAFVCFWIAGVYYGLYCWMRGYSAGMSVFWGIMGVLWICGSSEICAPLSRFGKFSAILLAAPLIYPILSLCCGRSYPQITSPIMPCSVAVFSIGLIASFEKKVNLVLAMMLLHWAMLSVPKVRLYGIVEDLFLTFCTFPILYIFLKNYVCEVLSAPTKPSAGAMKVCLFVLCCAIGALFAAMVLEEFAA